MGKIARRLVDAVVVSFALYAFAYVPFGTKTGLEHAIAVFTTPPARAAAAEAVEAGKRLIERARETANDEPPAQVKAVPASPTGADAGASADASLSYAIAAEP